MAYTVPTPDDLKAMFPAFASVDDATVGAWLTRAQREVDQSWPEGDYSYALMLVAAHLMASNGIGIASELSGLPEGVTDVHSGSFSMSISADAAKAASAGGYGSTRYGREFAALLKRVKGGPRVTGGIGGAYCTGYNGFAGPLPSWQVC